MKITLFFFSNLGLPKTQKTKQKKASVILLDNGGSTKTATTYSPTVTQYHRRDRA